MRRDIVKEIVVPISFTSNDLRTLRGTMTPNELYTSFGILALLMERGGEYQLTANEAISEIGAHTTSPGSYGNCLKIMESCGLIKTSKKNGRKICTLVSWDTVSNVDNRVRPAAPEASIEKLTEAFEEASLLQRPTIIASNSGWKSYTAMWTNPLREILSACGGYEAGADRVIRVCVRELSESGMTITSPRSVTGSCIAKIAELKRTKRERDSAGAGTR